MPQTVLRLVKAHAYGNDFLIARTADVARARDLADLARRACERHRGIGADGLLIIDEHETGARMRLLNADGSPSELSGNGVRCIGAWLAHTRDLEAGATLVIDSEAGPKTLTLLARAGGRSAFRADMGRPEFLRQERIDVAGTDRHRRGHARRQSAVRGPWPGDARAIARRLPRRSRCIRIFPKARTSSLPKSSARRRVRILIWERGVGPDRVVGHGHVRGGRRSGRLRWCEPYR